MELKKLVGKRVEITFNHLSRGEMTVTGRVLYTIDDAAVVLQKDTNLEHIVVPKQQFLTVRQRTPEA